MALGSNDFETRAQRMTRAQAEASEIDVGLRQYMLRVYNYMASGVALTGVIAAVVANDQSLVSAIMGGMVFWVLFIGILGLGWMAPKIISSGSTTAAQACFWAYAGLWGAFIAPLFLVYTGESIARVFFITAAAFAGTSLYGYTTKKDLAPMGRFLAMASIGILIAILVNAFLIQSSVLDYVVSIGAVLMFAGLTAYETQAIRNSYHEMDHADVATRKAVFGAFQLYGSFIGMFIFLLHIFGVARD
ncbi:MAG: Bax inhibitor-1/YccA family protein [Rhodospirillales bacterium]|nr:Bax inhibitor-1/YccA family protein [Rhodospirillales bacterium]